MVEHAICLKLAPATARKQGREFAKELDLKPQLNEETGRWDLRVDLARGGGLGQFHTFFHRVVGLCLRKAKLDAAGRKRQVAALVRPCSWEAFEVDHVNWNNLDCRPRNLQPTSRHRGEGRDGWHLKCLTHAQKKRKVRKLLKKKPAAQDN